VALREDARRTSRRLNRRVTVMREKMLRVSAPPDPSTWSDTGGDGRAHITSRLRGIHSGGAGVPVAKHGKRALSVGSGADEECAELRRQEPSSARTPWGAAYSEAGIGFSMFAPGIIRR